jgi:hypothetical protein
MEIPNTPVFPGHSRTCDVFLGGLMMASHDVRMFYYVWHDLWYDADRQCLVARYGREPHERRLRYLSEYTGGPEELLVFEVAYKLAASERLLPEKPREREPDDD